MFDDPFADVAVRDTHAPARRAAASDGLGWRYAHASTWVEAGAADEFEMPASNSHLVVLVTGGRYVIESRHGARWHRALYGPGSLGLTTAGAASTLRWRAASDERLTSLHIYLDADAVAAAERDLDGARPFTDALHVHDPHVVEAARGLGWALARSAPDLYADSAAHLLAARLVTAGRTPGTRHSAGLSASVPARVVEYMAANLAASVTLDDLSDVANLSKHHLLRQFKAATGHPPHRYLQRMRLERAECLLATSDAPVATIARLCGYSSDRQFSAAFARQTGLPPARYRAARSS